MIDFIKAQIQAEQMVRSCAAGYWDEGRAGYHGDCVLTSLTKAAQYCGFRLVPITTDPQKGHEALLALRVAEDEPLSVRSGGPWDGRATP